MSRMDRYESSSIKERTEKNKKLYETVTDIDVDYIDVNNATVIDSNYNDSNLTRSEYQQRKEINKLIKKDEVKEELNIKEEKNDDRIYDINEILKLARENKLFENDDKKRLINTEYNILTKLDISAIEEKDSKEDLRELIDKVYGNSREEKPKKVSTGGLLDDLINEDPVLSEETSKDILDKESNTIILDKSDEILPSLIDDEEESDKIEEEKTKVLEVTQESPKNDKIKEVEEDEDFLDDDIRRSRKALIFIIILVIIILLAISYLFYKYFL